MRILCFGKQGQVAMALQQYLVELNPEALLFLSRMDCDITHESQVSRAINQFKPTHIINAVAYTQVDACEDDDTCFKVNAEALNHMVSLANQVGAILIHFSTDYVFDGTKNGPYDETDAVCPINQYGRSKQLGEAIIKSAAKAFYILRIQWIYAKGTNHFIHKIIEHAKRGGPLRVVNDQIGSLTSADVVAKGVVNLLHNQPEFGLYHFRTLNHGSWYDVASYVVNKLQYECPVIPVDSSTFKTKAKRPCNGILNISKWIYADLYTPPTWQKALDDYLDVITPK